MSNEILIERAKQVDVIALLETYSELRRKASGEYEGPCPFCGGSDRLSVRADGWFCRVCKPIDPAHGWHSAIDFVQAQKGVDFLGAVELLTGDKLEAPVKPISAARKAESNKSAPFDAKRYENALWAAQGDLDASETAQAYLRGRGLENSTWIAYGVGLAVKAPLPVTNGEQTAPALMIPWYRAGKLIAVRYRFLEKQTYTNADGKTLSTKQTSRGSFRGALFGGQMMPDYVTLPVDQNGRCAEQLRTLILCEGEINTMSIWQVANGWRWDVLSLGSESAKLSDGAISLAKRYGRVLVWMDRKEVARGLKNDLGAFANYSPVIDGKEHDANDLLKLGKLGEYLREIRRLACDSDEERQRVEYDTQEYS